MQWHPKGWLKQRGVSIRAASRAADVSDTSMHLWDHAGAVPLSFWKLCWVQFAPNQRPAAPTLLHAALPFKITEAMRAGATQFDTAYRGVVPTTRESVAEPVAPQRQFTARRPRKARALAPDPAPTVPTRKTAVAARRGRPALVKETPVLEIAPVPTPVPTPSNGAEVEVLLALLVQVTAQRDQLTHRVYLLETQRRTEEQLRVRIAELERELTAFKELADAATAPTASTVLPAKVEPRAAERVEQLLKHRAPSLVEELRNLPRSAVAS